MILFSFAFFIKEKRKEGKPDYFYTRIVTPDELKKFALPPVELQEPKKLYQQRKEPPKKTEKEKDKTISKKTLPGSAIAPFRRSFKELSKPEKPHTGQDSAQVKDDLVDKGEPKKQLSEPLTGRTFDKFDKEIIGKLAQKEREKTPDSSITFSTKEYQYHGYMQRLKEKIEGIWKYPIDAAQKGIYGDLYIRFTIRKDGRLGAVNLIRTSGYKSLDDAALKALRDAEPYWPLPDEWGRDGLTITGHFVYTHYGSYIR